MWILCEVTNFAEEGQHCGRGQWEWVDGVDRCQKKLRKSKREKTLLLLSSSIKVVKEIKQNQTITHYQWITELLFTPAKSRKDVFLLHPLRIKRSFLIWVSSALYKKFVSLYLSFILSCEQVKPHYCMEFERALCSGPGLGYFFFHKEWDNKYLRFLGPLALSALPAQLCHCSTKQPWTICKFMGVAVCYKTFGN